MKVSLIFGTRPEAIKLAPLVLALQANPAFKCHVCVTGQHRELLDQVLETFGIVPDVDLRLMQPSQRLGRLTAAILEALDIYLETTKPDLVIVQGDTTTAFSAALAAFYHRIPVGHVEAGLRTGNLYSPWPEEANRILTSRLATLHFAPTASSRDHLLREGVRPETVFVTGNTVVDALFLAQKKIRAEPPAIPGLPAGALEQWRDLPLILITGHRRENFGAGFESICKAIAELARRFPGAKFIYPVHLNPRVREPVYNILHAAGVDNIYLTEPVPYLAFVALMDRSTLILTDSGGIQEEAPSLGKPVLVMRDTTERPEAVNAGSARVVGTDYMGIVQETSRLLTDRSAYEAMSKTYNPYGDGTAAAQILAICTSHFSVTA